MKKLLTTTLLLLFLVLTGCGDDKKNSNVIDDSFERKEMTAIEVAGCDTPTIKNDYHIVWSDEFNYNGYPDSSKWGYDIGTGNGGWGNLEAQYYTNRLDNAKVEDGSLVITAKKEEMGGCDYTSARLVTRNKGDFKYGYIEVKAKLAGGSGAWPAIWMLPTDYVYGGWPASGEIDIMEYVGNRPNQILGTCHTERYHGGNGKGTTIRRQSVETEFHRYGLEWTEDKIIFLFDGEPYYTYVNPKYSENNYKSYPFDQNFHILLNVAMGGNLGGNIGSDFTESSMYVDYVRVYQKDLKGIDKEKPTKAVISNYTSSSSSINLKWDKASDDYGIKQYEVVVNKEQIIATTNTNYTISNLEPNKKYTVQIIALDKGGNFSVSAPIEIKTTDILQAPGKIEVEQFFNYENANTLTNPSGGLSVEINNVGGENGYIICDVDAKSSGNYKISINAMVPRVGNKLYVYLVNSMLIGTKPVETKLIQSYGKYILIELSYTVRLVKGSNLIKIEGESASEGKIIIIDNMTLTKE